MILILPGIMSIPVRRSKEQEKQDWQWASRPLHDAYILQTKQYAFLRT